MTAGETGAFGGLVPRRVPESYVRAEVASFPLTSMGSFRSALTELSPSLAPDAARSVESWRAARDTQDLWQDCEHSLSEHAVGWSLDRLITLRDRYWFGAPPPRFYSRGLSGGASVPLHLYLRRLAKLHLSAWPGVTEVAQDVEVEGLDASAHYRWLTFAMPEDLLLAALEVESDEAPPLRVDMEPPVMVRRLLDEGVVDIHHHINAGMDFPLLWVSLLAELANDIEPNALESPGLAFPVATVFLRWLLAAAIARSVLADFLVGACHRDEVNFLRYLSRLKDEVAWLPWRRRTLERVLRALGSGKDEVLPGFYEMRSLYRAIHPGPSTTEAPETLDKIWESLDPIAKRLSLGARNGGEHWLIRNALSFIELWEPGALRRPVPEQGEGALAQAGGEAEPGDPRAIFARLFWQVVRVRCTFYRTLVQRPMTAGLQWFLRFFNRLYPARVPLHAARAVVSFEVAGHHEPIGAMEVRANPKPTAFDIGRELLELTKSWRRVLLGSQGRGAREPEFGVLFHLYKERDPRLRWLKGNPPAFGAGTHAEPAPYRLFRPGGRFAEYFSSRAEEVRALVSLLGARPVLLWLVRGLDVASDELSIPTWVLVPLYRYVQRKADSAAAMTSALGAPPLRLTAHVGEDYSHLMGGLRRIYECIHYLFSAKVSGGRLGHATALGVEPRLWAESAGAVTMSAEERLWDLVFEWRLYSGYRTAGELTAAGSPGRARQVENGIRDLSGRVFGFCCEPATMGEVHHVLHQIWTPPIGREEMHPGLDSFVRGLRHLDRDQVRDSKRVRRILERYRRRGEVFSRGQALVDVRLTELEIGALYAIQNALRNFVGARGFAVEVNPSSNLLIANLLDLRNHPILRLFPPEPQEGGPSPVPIAVGADDPLTFSTFLLREYSLLHEAARAAGYSERVAHEWLARIRETSMDARFTRPWTPSALSMAARLIRELEDYLQLKGTRTWTERLGLPEDPLEAGRTW